MSDELRGKVVFHYVLNKGAYADIVDAAIAFIRAETLEEAARVFSRYEDDPFTASTVAAHLRKMKDA